ncbi:MAG: peptide chain release factor N(5)-glutamine methyltransferase [Roseimicrobium sp.]
MKNLLETLQSGADYLAKRGVEDARLSMEHLLAHVLGCRRLDLYLRFDQTLTEAQLVPLRDLTRRRGEGEPLQHVLGTVEFYRQEFVSDHRALIPRPETEHLVCILVEQVFRQAPPERVLDMGAGSGCIGLSLAKAWPGAAVTLADVSEDALELARYNGERVGLATSGVKFVRSDLFEKLGGERYDLIVANLPYIPTGDIPNLSREVRRDPVLALDGGPTGLAIIERLLAESPFHLRPRGCVALELQHDQSAAVCARLHSLGYSGIQVQRDLSGIERFVFASYVAPPVAQPEPETPETILHES